MAFLTDSSFPPDVQIAHLDEQQLLGRLQRFCPAHLVGDDGAILCPTSGSNLVVTTDMLVDGVHFSVGLAQSGIQTTAPRDVGWRAAAANLSDLAAMGATPMGITVALGLPSELPVQWLDGLYEGLVACLSPYQTPIVGGDLCRSPILTVSITALGQVLPERQILRSSAQVGDVIVCTGVHGASRAGLELLLNPAWGKDLTMDCRQDLMRSHQRPTPRLDVPPLIWQIAPCARVAGMDSSDGLADAVIQICRASGVGARLWVEHLPVPAPLRQTTGLTESDCLDWVLYGGEDFELVLVVARTIAEPLVALVGGDAVIIGEMVAESGVHLVDKNGQYLGEPLSLDKGFQHFG